MTLTIRLPHLVAVLLIAGAFYALGQGGSSSLQPAVSPMENRTSIPGGTALYTISQPGSYVLSGNITVSKGNAINISTNNVTLDLGGYALVSSASPAAGTAISITAPHANIAISNGNIRGSGAVAGNTFSGGKFDKGIYYNPGTDTSHGGISVTNVNVQGCNTGIHLTSVLGTTSVSHCVVQHAASEGINAGRVESCAVTYCAGASIVAHKAMGCTVNSPDATGTGIDATTVSDCDVANGTGRGIVAAQLVRDSYASTTSDIAIDGGTQATAANCTGESRDRNGLTVSMASNCKGTSTDGSGLLAYLCAINCSGTSTSSYGLEANETALNCHGSSGSSLGLYAVGNGENCTGFSHDDTGLIAGRAFNCAGTTYTGSGMTFYDIGALCFGKINNTGSEDYVLGAGQSGVLTLP